MTVIKRTTAGDLETSDTKSMLSVEISVLRRFPLLTGLECLSKENLIRYPLSLYVKEVLSSLFPVIERFFTVNFII